MAPSLMARTDATDQEIADAVESKLIWDSSIFANDIDVSSDAGIVTLTGTAAILGEKNRATRIAKSRRGVRAVVNQIEVTPKSIPDPEVKAFADAALSADPVTKAFDITTGVSDGTLSLFGEVPGFFAKKLAGEVAASVIGVCAVNNDLRIAKQEERPDDIVATQIRKTLDDDIWVDSAGIDVTVNEGVVALTGTVGSAEEKDRAVARAWVSGVNEVNSTELVVEPSLKNEERRNRKNPSLSDEAIAEAVRDAFLYDPRVVSFQPEISVAGNVVTLRGEVSSLRAKEAAERDARNTVGVNRVLNLLKVRDPDVPTDEELEYDIKDALARDASISSYEIDVAANNGRIALTGAVDSRFERSQARLIASGISGVKEVSNRLTVEDENSRYFTYPYDDLFMPENDRVSWSSPGQSRSDRELRKEIEDEFFWSWQVDLDDVSVRVENGVATLTGQVKSRSERAAAEDSARQAGAFAVQNRLRIAGGTGDSTASAEQ
ncbi:MAG: BON domain-containing protein [Verrucomicrobiae bacterium]|nr:BON domain-containing protein [Verrucomicrobiae bacterium]